MNKEIKQIGGGLNWEKRDKRNFSFGKVFGTIDLAEIPADFIVAEPRQKDQGNTDFCTAFATTSASEPQEGVELNPFWSFAASKKLSGNPEKWGQTLLNALKVHKEYGAIEESEFNRERLDDRQLRYINNYPQELFENAKKHQKESFFEADGYNQVFDSFRATLWMNNAKKRVIITGVVLHDVWLKLGDGIAKEEGNPMVGDAFILIGQKTIDGEPYLIAQLSADERIGKKGRLYFPRNIINKYFIFGGFLWVDMPPEEARKKSWTWWQKIFYGIRNYFNDLIK